MSTRRAFITVLGGAAVWPLAARAQQVGRVPTIGFLGSATPATQGQWVAAFVQRLRELGWVEGHNLTIDYRWAEGRSERFADIAAEFVRLKVDVIVTVTTPAALAAKQATSVIPIVFAAAGTRLAPAWSRAWRDRAATSRPLPFLRKSGQAYGPLPEPRPTPAQRRDC
jgi:putative ABC transport system substrate-binding protein